MANRELRINITTTADLKKLTDLARELDTLETKLKGLDNAVFLDNLSQGLSAFKTQVNTVTGEVKELATALNALSGKKGLAGFQQSLNSGLVVNLKGVKVQVKGIGAEAAETANEIQKMNTATDNAVKLEREKGRIRRLNVGHAERTKAETAANTILARSLAKVVEEEGKAAAAATKTDAAANARIRIVQKETAAKRSIIRLNQQGQREADARNHAYNMELRQLKHIHAEEKARAVTSKQISRHEERHQQLTETGHILLRRRQVAQEKYNEGLREMNRTMGQASPSQMTKIKTALNEAYTELKQVDKELERGQESWVKYGRTVTEDFQKIDREMQDLLATQAKLRNNLDAATGAGRDSEIKQYTQDIENLDARIKKLTPNFERLNNLMRGGTMSRGPGINEQGLYTTNSYMMKGIEDSVLGRQDLVLGDRARDGMLQRMKATIGQYADQIQHVRRAEADWDAGFKQSIQTMRQFGNRLQSLAGSLSTFAGQLRSRANQALAGFGTAITGAVRTASSRFATLRATLDATGNSFIGFGRKANQGIKQSEVALNNFFSAGWSMLASGGIVSMFGQRIFDQLGRGLSNYMDQERAMVRLGISGDVWGTVPQGQQATTRDGTIAYEGSQPYQPGDIRPIQDLIFGLQSGRLGDTGDALTAFNAPELTDALYYFSSAIGANLLTQGTDTARALEPLLRVASVTQTDPETLIKGTLNTMMEFGYDPRAMIRSGDTSMFDQMAGMVAIASNVSSMEITDVFEAFKMMGPMISKLTGATEGAGLEDAMAAIFMASEVGLKGGNVGRGLDRLVSQLVDPDGPMQDAIKKYFGETATVESVFFGKDGYLKGGLQGVFETIIGSGLSEIEITKFMAEMFTQNASRAGTGILDIEKLRGGADVEGSWAWFQEQMSPENSQRFISTATAAMENTVGASFTNIGNAWNATTTNIVESIRGDLIGAFNQLADVIWNIAYAVRDNPALGRFVSALAGITASMALAVGGSMVLTGTILLVARAFHTLGGMIAPVMRLLVALPSLLAVMAPAFLLLAAAATAFFVAWQNDLGGLQTRLRGFWDSLGFETILSLLDRVATAVTRVGRAFSEFIGVIVMGVAGPFNNFQALMQDLLGNRMGTIATGNLLRFFADLRQSISAARAGLDDGFLGSLVDGANRAQTVFDNLATAVRSVVELTLLGSTTMPGLEAISAVGKALGVERPIHAVTRAIDVLSAALSFITDRVRWVISEWQQFTAALTATTSIGNVIGGVFRTLGAVIVGFILGITTAFGRIATIGSLALRTINEGLTGLVVRIRAAATALSSGGGFGGQMAQAMNLIARAIEAIGTRFDMLRARFTAVGGSLTAIAAMVGGAIGAALGVRLIAMITPGLGLLLKLGTVLGQVGVWVFQLGAQFAILGARIAITIGAAIVQFGLLIAQLTISAAMWAIDTMVTGINAAAKTTNAVATGAMTVAQAAATASTFSLTAAVLALDVAFLPLSAIIAAVVLAILALPVAFFATAAAIFVFVSATSGLGAGIRSVIDYFQGFWQVIQILRVHISALVSVARILIAPFAQLGQMFGVTTSGARILGMVLGGLVVVLSTLALVAFLKIIGPIVLAAAALYILFKAVEVLIDGLVWLYDSTVNLLGRFADVVEYSFNAVGDKIDWLVEKFDPLLNVLDKLLEFAGFDINVSEDGRTISVGLPGTSREIGLSTQGLSEGFQSGLLASIPMFGGAIATAQFAINSGDDVAGALNALRETLSGQEPTLFDIQREEARQAFAQAEFRMFNNSPTDLSLLQQQGVYTATDVAGLRNQTPEFQTNAYYQEPIPGFEIPRPFDTSGRLSAQQRNYVSVFSANIEDSLLQAGAGTGGALSPSQWLELRNAWADSMVTSFVSAVDNQQNPVFDPNDMSTIGYAQNQAWNQAVANQQQYLELTADAYSMQNMYGGYNIPAYGATPGGQAVNQVSPKTVPSGAAGGRTEKPVWERGQDLVADFIGEENADYLFSMLEGIVDFSSGAAMTVKDFNDAYYDAETSWLMKGMFPEYEQYQKDATMHAKWLAMKESFLERGWTLQAAEAEWYQTYGTAIPYEAPNLMDYIADDEALETAGEALDEWKEFMQAMLDGATTANLLAEDLGAGLRAIYGDTTAAGALGTLAESIMGNIDEEVLKANPWFTQDELMANAAIYAGDMARTETGGKNLHRILRPMLEDTARELGVTVDSLLAGLPQYFFDPSLMATAQTNMFSALEKLAPETGALLDLLGMTPDAQTGQVYEQMGLDFAELTQYAISNAMDGQDWDLSHYLMDAWNISHDQAMAYIRQNGLDPQVIGSAAFDGIEAAYLSSNGQVAAATTEFWEWIAEQTGNGADMMLDLTREQFEKIPEAWRILASNQGIKFNVIDPTDAEYAAARVIDAINGIRNASEDVQRLLRMPGISNINQTVFGPNPSGSGQQFQATGNSAFDLPGTTEFESMMNFSEMLRRGGDTDAATLGLRQIGEEVNGMVTVVNELNGMQITIPAPEFESLKTGADEMRGIVDEYYQNFVDEWNRKNSQSGIGDGTGEGAIKPPSFEEFLRGGAGGLLDENGEWIGPPMSEEKALSLFFGGNVDWGETIKFARDKTIDVTNAIQGAFQNSMRSDTQIQTAIDDAILKPLETLSTDSGKITTAAENVAKAFRTALSEAFSGGGTDGATTETGELTFAPATEASTGFAQGLVDSIATALGEATIDLTTFGTNFSNEARTWGTAAGQAFASAFQVAITTLSPPVVPPAGGGNNNASGSGFDENYVGSMGQGVQSAPMTFDDIIIKVSMEYTPQYSVVLSEIQTALTNLTIDSPIITVGMIKSENYTLTYSAINANILALSIANPKPTVDLVDNASGTISSILTSLGNINKTFTATVNVVKTGDTQPYAGGMFAEGGLTRGGMTLVGEEGPELIDVAAGSRVFTADATRTMLAGESMLSASPFTNSKGFTSQTNNNVSINLEINNPTVRNDSDIDRLADEVSRRLGREVEAMLNGQRPR